MIYKTVRTSRAVRRWIGAVSLLAAVPFLGCAALSSKPIQDFKSVAGKWEGNLTRQAAQYGTTTGAATWIINEDGTFEMRTGKWRAKGTMSIQDGKIVYSDGPLASGIASLHEGSGGRILYSTGDAPGALGAWSPAK